MMLVRSLRSRSIAVAARHWAPGVGAAPLGRIRSCAAAPGPAAASNAPPASDPAASTDAPPVTTEPTRLQLRRHMTTQAIPMVGFGVVDCVVMTQVGSTIDTVLGASLGISSITAAAIGLFCSDSCGVLFGGTIENFAGKLGLPSAGLTGQQMESAPARKWATMGRLFGVQIGVLLGSTTLLLQKSEPKDEKKAEDPDALKRQIAALQAKLDQAKR